MLIYFLYQIFLESDIYELLRIVSQIKKSMQQTVKFMYNFFLFISMVSIFTQVRFLYTTHTLESYTKF